MTVNSVQKKIRVSLTGAAGFIGSHLAKRLSDHGYYINWAGDSFKPAYGGDWGKIRSDLLNPNIEIEEVNLTDITSNELSDRLGNSDVVIHLAAYPGVRQGEIKTEEYFYNNVISTNTILSACEKSRVKLVFIASSSSIYGDRGLNLSCDESIANPIDLKSNYSMTKYINEIQALRFSHKKSIPIVALRFFTVFGELGRPDMAYSKFTSLMINNKELEIYGKDGGVRSMTYIEDAVEIIHKLIQVFSENNFTKFIGLTSLNIASNNQPITAMRMVEILSNALETQPKIVFSERPNEDAVATRASLSNLSSIIGEIPSTNIDKALTNYAKWHKENIDLFDL
jgi:UDP-glucuronate 4-epimerase